MTNRPATRRDVLKYAPALAAAPALASLLPQQAAYAATSVAAAAPKAAAALQPFALGEVALGKGLFADKRQLMLGFARGYDENRFLQVFRANAGLDTGGAVAPGGWEGLDGEANGNLRGHFTGHFLSMLSQACESTQDTALEAKLGNMIAALDECRDALRRDPELRSVDGPRGTTAVEVIRGSYQYLDLPPGTVDGVTSLTISAWVRPTASASWARIAEFADDKTTYLFLAQRDGDGKPRFALTRGGAAGEQVVTGSAPLAVGEWSHVALTLSGGSGTLYVNGDQVGQNSRMSLNPSDLGALAHGWIGRSSYDDPVFAGAYQDVNLWSKELSPEQVRELQSAGAADSSAGPGDLVSLLCDETSGATVHDHSGKDRHATLRRTWGGPSHPGFLAAYPETQFVTLESMTSSDYLVVWAPYYTVHKILKGLLDAHRATGDERALDLATGLCDWMHSRLSKLPVATRQRMWGLFSSGEFGGIVEAVLETYGHTKKPEHLQLAQYFDLDSLIDACAADRDVLKGLHANQHIPIFTGLLMMHDATGEERYAKAAHNFWRMVVPPRMFSIGGTSSGEFWQDRGVVAGILKDTDAETCCAYNMLKLSRELYLREQDPVYMDYYERAQLNQVLGSKQDRADAEKPLTTYFIGLQPGAVRDFTPKKGTTCCEGTGMESATKYQDSVYFRSTDQSTLHVNLYLPSTLSWEEKGVTVTQETRFPFEQGSVLRIGGGSSEFALKLRVPEWVGDGFAVRVNGKPIGESARPGTYVTVARTWRDGDTVEVAMPFELRAERTPDEPAVQSLRYGPVHLVARDSRTTWLTFSLYGTAKLSGDLSAALRPVPGKPLHFRLGDTELAPFFEGTTDPFHSYVRRSEPHVVFASLDSGAANPTRDDGTSLLDEVWSAAPFRNKTAFVTRVDAVSAAWVESGLLSSADRQRVMETARRADFG